MIAALARRAFGSRASRKLARYQRTADDIIALAPKLAALSADELSTRMQELRQRARNGAALEALTTPCFALVREAARRTLGQQHVTAQLVGGLALRDGGIAEMKTGEGKTLAATLVSVLFALAGRGVHIAAPNDYLSARDAGWMRPVYAALGISVGLVTQQVEDDSRRIAYGCDVTYGIASEFAFDYLRDNMKFSAADCVQRGHAFALVDEADAVLIDDAGMPLALFGPSGDHSALYQSIDAIIASLPDKGYTRDEDNRRVALTDPGYDLVEAALRQCGLLKAGVSLHDIAAISTLHHVVQALRAHKLLMRDRDYIIYAEDIVIIDRHTGRMMPGRRYDEGLHQALEAKEGMPVGEETRTLASITFQTFFRRYERLAGMTGTALPDAAEYSSIYDLDVVAVPPHRPVIRGDDNVLHPTRAEKMHAVLQAVEDAHARRQPVLIGAPTIEGSEAIAACLEQRGWLRACGSAGDAVTRSFNVLNARHHADEARIIAQAGQPGAVTVATAMAGRGTDIQLNDICLAAGGLLVIGTEHHELARLDDQLRGRAGRQGDPGAAIFHASLEDASLQHARGSLSARTNDAAVHPAIGGRLISAMQRRNAAHGLEARLGLLRFEDIIQQQRETVHALRIDIRDGADPLQRVRQLSHETIDDLMQRYAGAAGWDRGGLDSAVRSILTLAVPLPERLETGGVTTLHAAIAREADDWMQRKIDGIGTERLGEVLRTVMLALLDQLWAEQGEKLDHLRRRVGDRRLPAHRIAAEFRIEAFALFELMIRDFRHEVTTHAMRVGFS